MRFRASHAWWTAQALGARWSRSDAKSVGETSRFHLSSDSRGGNEWYRESAKAKSEDVLGDCASNTDPGVFVCKAYKQSSRSPRSPASDLVGLHTLAFDYWYERIEADGFKVARDPSVETSLLRSSTAPESYPAALGESNRLAGILRPMSCGEMRISASSA